MTEFQMRVYYCQKQDLELPHVSLMSSANKMTEFQMRVYYCQNKTWTYLMLSALCVVC